MIDYAFNYADLEYFLLIFIRTLSFIYVAPFFSMSNTPRNIRIAFSFFLALLMYYAAPRPEIVYDTLLGYMIIVMKEIMTGIIIGFGANLCSTIVAFAGQVADMEMGLSMVNLMDPSTRQNTTITGVYYNYMVLLILILSGMHKYLIRAYAETFLLIPVNGAVIDSEALLQSLLIFMSSYIIVGFRICLPIFAAMLILNAVLGILAKVSPQLNMFAVGIQMKVLLGLSILFLTTSMLPGAANFVYEQMRHMVVSFVEVMRST
ncbi:MAG: flagellar biosynthetic protein FliR [Lachnospiraceae bacterium]|nr:flagellar biosynthetic protein FliR [Lachnospiraceae bacterium]